MNTTNIGNRAESAVSSYLEDHGHEIVVRNWRTRMCEIDIVSTSENEDGENEIFFVEVKMRESDHFGGGIGAISQSKLRQMTRAAELFIAQHSEFSDHQPLLAAAIVNGNFAVQNFIILD
ncbi:YraN family protein [Candidatus Saccharibacteria bacterium]|nr:YraN family protein [Candidatus Saccharibacteria bacterium]